jgi:hypothetical protein
MTEWGTYEDHENFMKSPIYHPFGDSLKALLSDEWAFCHVPLDPVSTNAFKGPVVSYRTVTLKPGLDRQKVKDVLNKALMDTGRTFSKCHGVGWGFTREDENKLVVISSWESKEVGIGFWSVILLESLTFFQQAHVNEFTQTEEYKKVAPEFREMVEASECFHLNIKHFDPSK